MDEAHAVEKFLPAPPSEPDISLPGFHDLHCLVNFQDYDHHFLLREVFADVFKGCGRVDCEGITIRYSTTSAGQKVLAGVANAIGNYTVEQVSMARGNLYSTSNAFNVGVLEEKTFVIPGNVSRQVCPISSMLPDFRFYLYVSKGAQAHVEFHFRVFGPVIRRFFTTDLQSQDAAKKPSEEGSTVNATGSRSV